MSRTNVSPVYTPMQTKDTAQNANNEKMRQAIDLLRTEVNKLKADVSALKSKEK